MRSPCNVPIETRIAFDSRMCYRFRPVGGAIWEISDQNDVPKTSRWDRQMRWRRLPTAIVLIIFVATLVATNFQVSNAQQNIETADTIEALFMGSGQLTPSDGFPACTINIWSGFPRGTTVTVRVSTIVSENVRQAIQQALQQVPQATNGAISTTFELTDDPDPMPQLSVTT